MSGHKLDEVQLEKYMVHNVQGFGGGPLQVSKFNYGQSNPTYLIKDKSNHKYVLRKQPSGKLLPSAHAVDREYKVLKALSTTNVPVPPVYCLCEDPSVLGTSFYIMEFLEGRVITDATLGDLPVQEQSNVILELYRVLALLHKVDYKSIGLSDYGPTGGYVKRQLKRWGGQYQKMREERPQDSSPEMDELIRYLIANESSVSKDDRVTLVHGDYKLDNVMFHPTECRIIAVLDWELSTLGHPLSDLAYVSMAWHLPPEARLPSSQNTTHTLPPLQQALQVYAAYTYINLPIPYWDYYLSLSVFRLAAIVYGVYIRGVKGNASSPEAVLMKSVAEALAATGLKIIRSNNSKL